MTSGKKALDETRSERERSRGSTNERDVGSALRSVYQKAIDEKVPDDLLALLGKLD